VLMKIVEFCFAFSIAEVEGQARNETLNISCDINICTLYIVQAPEDAIQRHSYIKVRHQKLISMWTRSDVHVSHRRT